MPVSTTINGTSRALQEARARGAHTVRVKADVLEALLNGYQLLAAAFAEIESKKENENG